MDVQGLDMVIHPNKEDTTNKDECTENSQHASVSNRLEYAIATLCEPVCTEIFETVLQRHVIIKLRYEIERFNKHNTSR